MILTFHRSLYPPAAVRSAIEAYGELASFELTERDHETAVAVGDIDPDYADFADELIDAFNNHALFEAIKTSRAAS